MIIKIIFSTPMDGNVLYGHLTVHTYPLSVAKESPEVAGHQGKQQEPPISVETFHGPH